MILIEFYFLQKEDAVMRREIVKALGLLTQIGVAMLVPILLCVVVGAFLDNLFNCSPICLIIFVIMGVMAAFRSLYMITKEYFK